MVDTPLISDPAGQAMRLGLGLYLVPLAFVANPYLLYPSTHAILALFAFFKVGLGLWLLSMSLIGKSSPLLRLTLFTTGLAAIFLFGVGIS